MACDLGFTGLYLIIFFLTLLHIFPDLNLISLFGIIIHTPLQLPLSTTFRAVNALNVTSVEMVEV